MNESKGGREDKKKYGMRRGERIHEYLGGKEDKKKIGMRRGERIEEYLRGRNGKEIEEGMGKKGESDV